VGGVRTDTAPLPRAPLVNLPGQIAQQIHLMQQEGAKTMRIRLVPEHLGEVRIEIHGTAEHLRVRMVSANPAVRDALNSQMSNLRQALEGQGLTLGDVSVGPGNEQRDTPYRRENMPRGQNTSEPQVFGASATATSVGAPTIRYTLDASALDVLA